MSRMTLKSSMKKRILSLVIAVVFLSLTGVFPSGLIETKVSAAKNNGELSI